jgi:hypothetical protein
MRELPDVVDPTSLQRGHIYRVLLSLSTLNNVVATGIWSSLYGSEVKKYETGWHTLPTWDVAVARKNGAAGFPVSQIKTIQRLSIESSTRWVYKTVAPSRLTGFPSRPSRMPPKRTATPRLLPWESHLHPRFFTLLSFVWLWRQALLWHKPQPNRQGCLRGSRASARRRFVHWRLNSRRQFARNVAAVNTAFLPKSPTWLAHRAITN